MPKGDRSSDEWPVPIHSAKESTIKLSKESTKKKNSISLFLSLLLSSLHTCIIKSRNDCNLTVALAQ